MIDPGGVQTGNTPLENIQGIKIQNIQDKIQQKKKSNTDCCSKTSGMVPE